MMYLNVFYNNNNIMHELCFGCVSCHNMILFGLSDISNVIILPLELIKLKSTFITPDIITRTIIHVIRYIGCLKYTRGDVFILFLNPCTVFLTYIINTICEREAF